MSNGPVGAVSTPGSVWPRGRAAGQLLAALLVVIGVTVSIGATRGDVALSGWFRDLPAARLAGGIDIAMLGLAIVCFDASPILARLGRAIAWVSIAFTVSELAAWTFSFTHPVEHLGLSGLAASGSRPQLTPRPELLGLLALAVGYLSARRRAGAMAVLAIAAGLVGLFSGVAFAYGDRTNDILSSDLPETAVALPDALCLVLGAVAVLLLEPNRGLVGWYMGDTPARGQLRRLTPPLSLLPIVVVGASEWSALGDRINDQRALTLVALTLSIAVMAVASSGARGVDELEDRMRVLEEQAQQMDRVQRRAQSATLATALARARTTSEVLDVLRSLGRTTAEADGVSISLADETGRALHLLKDPSTSAADAARFAEVTLVMSLPHTEAARFRRPVLVHNMDEHRRRYPEVVEAMERRGAVATAAMPLLSSDGVSLGVASFFWTRPMVFDEFEVLTLSTVADLAAQTLERARLTDLAARDSSRSAALARFAGELAAISTTTDILEWAPLHASAAFAASYSTITKIELMKEAPTIVGQCARENVPFFIGNLPDYAERFPASLQDTGVLAIQSLVCLPVRTSEETVAAVLTLGWPQLVEFDETTKSLLVTVAALCGHSLRRAGVSEAREESALALAELSRRLATATTAEQIGAAIADLARVPVGARFASMAMRDQSGVSVRRYQSSNLEPSILAEYGDRSIEERLPLHDALRLNAAVVLRNRDEIKERYPGLLDGLGQLGVEAVAAFPVARQDGVARACIGFSWTGPIEFDVNTMATLETITETCSQALDRAMPADTRARSL
jgi:GAF domain-containing protein